jgi:hypothetical protein
MKPDKMAYCQEKNTFYKILVWLKTVQNTGSDCLLTIFIHTKTIHQPIYHIVITLNNVKDVFQP